MIYTRPLIHQLWSGSNWLGKLLVIPLTVFFVGLIIAHVATRP